MKKRSRIFAIIGVILLVSLYLSTLVFALFDRTESLWLLKASIICTVVIPVLLYGYRLLYKVTNNKDKDDVDRT
jgi:hypothetical protein